MTSTGRDSSGTDSKALDEHEASPDPSTRTCRATEATSVLSTFSFTPLGPLLHLGDQCQPLEPGAGQLPHHPRHGSVVRLLVGAHEYTLIQAAAGIRDGL